MEKITTQAPIQTRANTTQSHERLFTVLAAEAISRCRELNTENTMKRFDMWNTYGLRIEQDYLSKEHTKESRANYIGELIAGRYAILETNYGISSHERTVVRDDDAEVEEIVKSEVKSLIDAGGMTVAESRFIHCEDCVRIIAPVAAQTSSCPESENHVLGQVTKRGLFLLAPPQTKDWLKKTLTCSSKQANDRVYSAVDNLPGAVQASKQREFGVDLQEFEIDKGFVLDPLIALSMMRKVARELGIGDIDQITLGVDTLKNFVPYSGLTGNAQGVTYIASGLIPPYGKGTQPIDGFHFPALPLFMSEYPRNIQSKVYDSFQREVSKVHRKFAAVTHALLEQQEIGYLEDKQIKTEEVSRVIKGYMKEKRYREAMLEYRRSLFEEVSAEYIPFCKDNDLKPDKDLVKWLNLMQSLFYGIPVDTQ